MKSERITLATDRRERPIAFTELLWSSSPSNWAGFTMERHRIGPQGILQNFVVEETLLGLCVAGEAELRFDDGRRSCRATARPGHFNLLERGEQPRSIEWTGMRETLYVKIELRLLKAFFPQHRAIDRVQPQYAAWDTQVTRLIRCMVDEVEAGAPAGAAYAESLSLALASYLLQRYGDSSAAEAPAARAFGAPMAARLLDYVQAHLARNLSLIELANVVGLSPNYFLQVFRNTFQTTPHRYILEKRIDEAKRQLRSGDHAISEVGLALGFADQSHFSSTFRRVTGQTPGQFRHGSDALSKSPSD